MAENNPTVEYRDIQGYPGYRVGNDGSVWSRWRTCRQGKILSDKWHRMKASIQKHKRTPARRYHYLNLVVDGKATTFRVHRLVLTAFIGPCPEGMQCRHLNSDPSDNRLTNLAWGTKEENTADCRANGAYTHTPRNRRYTYDGKTLSLKEWATLRNVRYTTLYQRVTYLGMTFEEAITRPFLGVAGNGPKPKIKPS